MATTNLDLLSELVRQAVYLLDERTPNLDFLLSAIGTHPYVLLGEASHGTHEFYRVRAEITKRLIREKGFRTIAIEADWPDTARINRYIQGIGEDKEAIDALSDFQRFPSWMWRNADFLDFVGWLRHYNDPLPPEDKVEIFGLDLYSLHASMAAVIDYLEKVDRVQAQRARARYACFDMFGGDSQAYGYAAGLGLSHTCETEVLTQLVELQERAAHSFTLRDSREVFSAEQNAFVVKNAEEYYRTMFFGDVSSRISGVVSRGGRVDLAQEDLNRVKSPTLLIVGERDETVLAINRQALDELGTQRKQIIIVPNASHLFEEEGALEKVASLAADWFLANL